MDALTQVEEKLRSLTRRLTLETRYFHDCAIAEADDGRLPLLEGNFVETPRSLAVRAEMSAASFVTINQQLDKLLATLPEDAGEEAQHEVLDRLIEDNEDAGTALRREAESAEAMLLKVREALKVIGDGRSRDALQQLSMQVELIARGLKPDRSFAGM